MGPLFSWSNRQGRNAFPVPRQTNDGLGDSGRESCTPLALVSGMACYEMQVELSQVASPPQSDASTTPVEGQDLPCLGTARTYSFSRMATVLSEVTTAKS